MQISIINHSNGRVPDEDLRTAARAISRQVREGVAPGRVGRRGVGHRF